MSSATNDIPLEVVGEEEVVVLGDQPLVQPDRPNVKRKGKTKLKRKRFSVDYLLPVNFSLLLVKLLANLVEIGAVLRLILFFFLVG